MKRVSLEHHLCLWRFSKNKFRSQLFASLGESSITNFKLYLTFLEIDEKHSFGYVISWGIFTNLQQVKPNSFACFKILYKY